MELPERINQQRIGHIVGSYRLEGEEINDFAVYLTMLLQTYPSFLVELALVEAIADQWLQVPLVRGVVFLQCTRSKLEAWMGGQQITTSITPGQFHQITGLSPAPIFDPQTF